MISDFQDMWYHKNNCNSVQILIWKVYRYKNIIKKLGVHIIWWSPAAFDCKSSTELCSIFIFVSRQISLNIVNSRHESPLFTWKVLTSYNYSPTPRISNFWRKTPTISNTLFLKKFIVHFNFNIFSYLGLKISKLKITELCFG